jgi:quinol-cytochrome oxidoreductase complex cytochrome b subunit
MFASILLLCLLPWLDRSKVRSATFRPIYKQLYWIFLADCLVLGWIGANPPEGMMLLIGRIATFWYFFHLLILLPLVPYWEKTKELPESISAAVTANGEGSKETSS